MTQGAPDSPGEADRVRTDFRPHMTDNDTARGEKRGVLSTGRAKSLDKTKDADADAADDSDDEEA